MQLTSTLRHALAWLSIAFVGTRMALPASVVLPVAICRVHASCLIGLLYKGRQA